MRRVLASFKLNPYEVLDIPLSAVYDDPDSIVTLVKKTYRTKSLLIHPCVSSLG
jgi:DnaJ family protein C protein 8